MRIYRALLLWLCLVAPLLPQQANEGPKDEKAQKTYKHAWESVHNRMFVAALDEFKKADKQDGGHCLGCQKNMIRFGEDLQDWNVAEAAAGEMVAEAQGATAIALAHYQFGEVFMREAAVRRKPDFYSRAHDEFVKALVSAPKFPAALFSDGFVLAQLKQDAAAKAQFTQFTALRPAGDPQRLRAQRYIDDPELARARLAPPFALTTIDGQRISMDELQGKVVLIDFWATWCGPCREALPHMQKIARVFQGQPLVVLSISLDTDEKKWKDFIAKNEMTWLQYREDGFTGAMPKLFGVEAIPHTFTIDADGVLQDEHIGDAAIEGKLKKLVARAQQIQAPGKSQ